MPIISTFFGITVYFYYIDKKKHHRPHLHVKYGEFKAGIAIDNGDVLYGGLPISKMKLVQAWIEIHNQELMDDWNLAVNGQKPFKIQPLK
jgi:hypothetical protein